MAFNERKAAQMAAFYLQKNQGRLEILKLMKLLYLADRLAMDWYESPISGDRMVSMPHGPVLSQTLDLMNGNRPCGNDGWPAWIADRESYEVGLQPEKAGTTADDLSALSDAEIEVLDQVWNDFGHMRKFDLVDYTHDRCAEWKDPNGSSRPISYEDVFVALGRDAEHAREAAQDLESQNSVDRIFARL